eukprot:8484171-Alexandrium_andersonii.AAC.1
MAHLDTTSRRAFEQRSADLPPRSAARAEVVLQTADEAPRRVPPDASAVVALRGSDDPEHPHAP